MPRTRTRPATTTPKRRRRGVTVVAVADPEFEHAYGGCFIAKTSDGWEGAKRSTRERAQAEGEAHLASLEQPEDTTEE